MLETLVECKEREMGTGAKEGHAYVDWNHEDSFAFMPINNSQEM